MQSQVIIDRFLNSANIQSYKLSANEKLVLYVLASMMGNKSTCWPSYSTLEIKCSLSSRTIMRNIKLLESKNIIDVVRSKNGNNIYKFYPQVVSISHPGVTHSHGGVSISHTNNIINNIKNIKGISIKKRSLAKTAEKPSPLLEDFITRNK